ncbi:glucose-6-phosphate isomerase [Leuconostoc mesenteroides]|uniref:glucose-6-phosphate isomerase n=1 Tax=Leuconostoc mesenteroides TaxID=1245 RepID=UPI0009FCB72C|nr:glucose-6-phosphate isomerase [Leuconostoc mesenteroides]ORI47905.1 glucose-6-phosphate isomerase [Leuconostoc mesenteroides subsp. cremoris]ORI48968.1 glucose-6-phosphate isomerase [Leuconostoc mesenteroides subsp. cremoris]ORI50682.1 glucose-6-phosphate isomerase [Leuconostoc mesenteroides subsp. cremoris]ORI57102.1 glucose-6-phosphate isomerase [Leuconostoc mesenteroides subsp. cremoris]ORI60223.1 glucose-6-phosphate isomerase [Leuconostoc mesenteroides subsp. cremoris]
MAHITFDTKNIENFVADHELDEMQPLIKMADEQLRNRSGAGAEYSDWITLPTDYDKDEFARIQTAAQKIQSDSKVLVVIGIGGSYLGAKMAVDFLNPMFNNELADNQRQGVKIYFAGNSTSASYINDLVRVIGDQDFSVNVISKSGTTTEPSIAFRVFKQLLEKKYGAEAAKQRIYATTDANRGALHDEAKISGCETFTIPDGVGGRFSVLTAVGLLPIAASGADIEALMTGARDAQEEYSDSDIKNNEAYKYAAVRRILYDKGYTTELLINWEPTMQYLSEWWKQLMGESEGKNQKGIYPSSANFSTDLHSLGQYIQEGRRDLFETVVKLDNPVSNIDLPHEDGNNDGLQYLEGVTIDEVNTKASQGVTLAHVDGGVPNLAVHLPAQDAYSLGYLIYFFEIAVGASGYTFGINPFNQPGVEAYKTAMFALLGKPGYEEQTKVYRVRLGK